MAFDINVKRKEQPKLKIEERISSFLETVKPFIKEEILEQTKRCLSCPNPKCVEGCPIHLPIPQFIKAIGEGRDEEAYDLVYNVSPLSGICAIVCDQAKQCEGKCIRGIKDKPVNIGAIHRYISFLDYYKKPNICIKKDAKVAIIGAGPSGLSCGYELAKNGYNVTIYEKESSIGGVPYFGIPQFRLADKELNNALKPFLDVGISFIFNSKVKLDDIIDKFDAFYIAIGTQISKKMWIKGEDLPGVISGEEFLKDIKIFHNLDKYKDYKNIFVVGAGNVAMDVSRTMRRLNKNVTIVYRRSIDEAPCRKDELDEAKEEGVELKFLTNPVEFIGKDKLEQIKLIKMELGEPDASGRRKPIEIPNTEYLLDADCVVLALGSNIEEDIVNGIDLDHHLIKVNNHQTSNPKVFAGGDCVTGSNTVVHAVKAGLDAAKEIAEYLK